MLQLPEECAFHSPDITPHGGCLHLVVCFTFAAMTPVLQVHGGWHCLVVVTLSYFLLLFPHHILWLDPQDVPVPTRVPYRQHTTPAELC